jgi:hypothetical protein
MTTRIKCFQKRLFGSPVKYKGDIRQDRGDFGYDDGKWMLMDRDHAVLEVLILVILVILVVLSRVAVLPCLILFNTYVLHILKRSLRGFVCSAFSLVVYGLHYWQTVRDWTKVTCYKHMIWCDVMSLDYENWQCTELDPETLRNRHWIVRMLSAHGVYRYLDEWAILQTWYRNVCLIYFSLCTEFYSLNCKWDVKLVTGNITCLQLQRRFVYINGEIADSVFSLKRIIYCCIPRFLKFISSLFTGLHVGLELPGY